MGHIFFVGCVMGTLALLAPLLRIVGEGQRKTRQPRPHQTREQRHAHTQHVLKRVMSGGMFVRLSTSLPMCSLLSLTYAHGDPKAGVLPQLRNLCHSRGGEAELWPCDAHSLPVAALKEAALKLLRRICVVLKDECFLGVNEGEAASSPLLAPMMYNHQHAGPLRSTCMLYDVGKVQSTKYFSINSSGYLVLDFGRHTQVKQRKKRGRGHEGMVDVVEVKPLQLAGSKVVCWLFHGCPGGDEECAHLCGHPDCLNPRHLKWVTKRDNQLMKRYHMSGGRGQVEGGHIGLEWG